MDYDTCVKIAGVNPALPFDAYSEGEKALVIFCEKLEGYNSSTLLAIRNAINEVLTNRKEVISA